MALGLVIVAVVVSYSLLFVLIITKTLGNVFLNEYLCEFNEHTNPDGKQKGKSF